MRRLSLKETETCGEFREVETKLDQLIMLLDENCLRAASGRDNEIENLLREIIERLRPIQEEWNNDLEEAEDNLAKMKEKEEEWESMADNLRDALSDLIDAVKEAEIDVPDVQYAEKALAEAEAEKG